MGNPNRWAAKQWILFYSLTISLFLDEVKEPVARLTNGKAASALGTSAALLSAGGVSIIYN